MSYLQTFQMSADIWPNGGTRLSPAECAFLLAEMDALVEKYQAEVQAGSSNPVLLRMVEHHLEGLKFIRAKIDEGQRNKPKGELT